MQADDGDHPDVLAGRLGHHPASLLDEQERGLPRDRPRRRERCDLAQAVPGGDADVLEAIAFAPDLVRRPANGHYTWLDDVGAVELLAGTFEAELAHRNFKQFLGRLEQPA